MNPKSQMQDQSDSSSHLSILFAYFLGVIVWVAVVFLAAYLDSTHMFGYARLLWPIWYWWFFVAPITATSCLFIPSRQTPIWAVGGFSLLLVICCKAVFILLHLLASGHDDPRATIMTVAQVPCALATGFLMRAIRVHPTVVPVGSLILALAASMVISA